MCKIAIVFSSIDKNREIFIKLNCNLRFLGKIEKKY